MGRRPRGEAPVEGGAGRYDNPMLAVGAASASAAAHGNGRRGRRRVSSPSAGQRRPRRSTTRRKEKEPGKMSPKSTAAKKSVASSPPPTETSVLARLSERLAANATEDMEDQLAAERQGRLRALEQCREVEAQLTEAQLASAMAEDRAQRAEWARDQFSAKLDQQVSDAERQIMLLREEMGTCKEELVQELRSARSKADAANKAEHRAVEQAAAAQRRVAECEEKAAAAHRAAALAEHQQQRTASEAAETKILADAEVDRRIKSLQEGFERERITLKEAVAVAQLARTEAVADASELRVQLAEQTLELKGLRVELAQSQTAIASAQQAWTKQGRTLESTEAEATRKAEHAHRVVCQELTAVEQQMAAMKVDAARQEKAAAANAEKLRAEAESAQRDASRMAEELEAWNKVSNSATGRQDTHASAFEVEEPASPRTQQLFESRLRREAFERAAQLRSVSAQLHAYSATDTDEPILFPPAPAATGKLPTSSRKLPPSVPAAVVKEVTARKTLVKAPLDSKLRETIEKYAEFLSKEPDHDKRRQKEDKARQRFHSKPEFRFLQPDGEGSSYYRHLLNVGPVASSVQAE